MKHFLALLAFVPSLLPAAVYQAQGVLSGEPTATSILLQTRLTAIPGPELAEDEEVPGAAGWVQFEWSTAADFADARVSEVLTAAAEQDFIVRASVDGLEPGTLYYFRTRVGETAETLVASLTGRFRTLPGGQAPADVSFIVGSCMNYNKMMFGKEAGGDVSVVTATEEDKKLGFPAFAAMAPLTPDFFIGTGDIVYYDNKINAAKTLPELRRCWHQQFRFPRMVRFFAAVPAYWSKDDHDFRFNDSDNASDQLPLPQTGIELFKEQLPIAPMAAREAPTYRTHRVSRDLQIWLTEGRDYRSPNKMKDGPEKTLWGAEQKAWLQRTLKESDATWKILISPTPMVGPDDAKKKDNHTNLGGFRHEADEFFAWLKAEEITNFMTFCGDRHWQYHSVHPSGVEEFACGALNDENSRVGVKPGSKKGTDPEGLIQQLYTYPKPTGGFLHVVAGADGGLKIEFRDDEGAVLNTVTKAGR